MSRAKLRARHFVFPQKLIYSHLIFFSGGSKFFWSCMWKAETLCCSQNFHARPRLSQSILIFGNRWDVLHFSLCFPSPQENPNYFPILAGSPLSFPSFSLPRTGNFIGSLSPPFSHPFFSWRVHFVWYFRSEAGEFIFIVFPVTRFPGNFRQSCPDVILKWLGVICIFFLLQIHTKRFWLVVFFLASS